MLAHAEVCHNALVEFTSKEAFEASNDLALGPAISGAACDVVDGRLVEPHPDDGGSIGSIPACAGEPPEDAADLVVVGVYPRVCGGAVTTESLRSRKRGLSSRVRGSQEQTTRNDQLNETVH